MHATHRHLIVPPGTIKPPEDASPSKLRTLRFTPKFLDEHSLDRAADLEEVDSKEGVLWLNIDGVGDANALKTVGTHFGLHALALEDVVNLHQRPKAEEYDDHIYIVVHMPIPGDQLELEQISIFLGKHYVITVQEIVGDCLDPVRERIRKSRGRVRQQRSDYLAYAILDTITDSYFPIVDQFNDRLEKLEDKIIHNPDTHTIEQLHSLRKEIHRLRRTLFMARESASLLSRGELKQISDETQVFYRDYHDHLAQLIDATEGCHELSIGLMNLHASRVANQMNEVMKVLTLIATIFIPLSFIASLYGMNFDREASPWNMPELAWRFGYPFAISLMLVTALLFVIYFFRKGWFSNR